MIFSRVYTKIIQIPDTQTPDSSEYYKFLCQELEWSLLVVTNLAVTDKCPNLIPVFRCHLNSAPTVVRFWCHCLKSGPKMDKKAIKQITVLTGIQRPFEFQTIWQPDMLPLFEYWISLVFGSSLYVLIFALCRIFSHPNVMPVIGCCNSPPNLVVISQLMPIGSLYQVRTHSFKGHSLLFVA